MGLEGQYAASLSVLLMNIQLALHYLLIAVQHCAVNDIIGLPYLNSTPYVTASLWMPHQVSTARNGPLTSSSKNFRTETVESAKGKWFYSQEEPGASLSIRA